jgi:hypothetical protein
MTVNNGPVPSVNRTKPAQKKRERWNFAGSEFRISGRLQDFRGKAFLLQSRFEAKIG